MGRPADEHRAIIWRNAFLGDGGPAATVRYVLLLLSTYMDADGDKAYPSYDTLARRLGVNVSTVRRAVKDAEKAGWVQIVKRRGGSGGHFRQYLPTFPDGWALRLLPEPGDLRAAAVPSPQLAKGGVGTVPTPGPSNGTGVGAAPTRVGAAPPGLGRVRVRSGHSAYQEFRRVQKSSEREAHTRGELNSVPVNFEPPPELEDQDVLFAALSHQLRCQASKAIGGRPNLPITHARDLQYVPAPVLRALQYAVMTTAGASR